MSELTFEQLPQAVTMLTKEISEIKDLLIDKSNNPPTDSAEQFLTIRETAEFLKLSVPTIYSKVSKGQLPVMKRGKRLYFSSLELEEYIKVGRKKSNSDISGDVDDILSNHKKGLK